MMKTIKYLQLARKAFKAGRLGDGTLLKMAAFNILGTKKTRLALMRLPSLIQHHDLSMLGRYPENSLGYQYAKHMTDNQLYTFEMTKLYYKLAQSHAFAVRYALTHDLIHLVLDFDTSYAGEMGVLAFASAQHYSSLQRYIAFPLAMLLYPFFSPRQIKTIYQNALRGWSLGKNGRFALTYPFESRWDLPLRKVKQDLFS